MTTTTHTESTIHYTEQYQPSSIIETLIQQKRNAHLIKDQTGSGATFSTLTLHNEKILLLSPTVSLVKDKERQYREGLFKKTNAQFLYGNAIDKKKQIKPQAIGSHLVMGTADQLVKIDYELFAKNGYTLIIDELHVDVMSSLFRPVFREPFLGLIKSFKQHNSIITVTATPLDIYPPIFNDFDIVKLTSDNGIKQDVVYTDNNSTFWKHFDDCLNCIEDDPIIFFTNDSRTINKVCSKIDDVGLLNRVKLIVGDTLRIKNEILHKIDTDCQTPLLYICSSAAIEGIDINTPTPPHILIQNKIASDYGLFSVQQIVQALGRYRGEYDSAILYHDRSGIKNDIEERSYTEIEQTAIKNITHTEKHIGRFSYLKSQLKKYDYYISKDTVITGIKDKFKGKKVLLDVYVKNVLELNDDEFEHDFYVVCNNVRVDKRYFGFNVKIAFAFLVAKIFKDVDLPLDLLDLVCSGKARFDTNLRCFRSVLIDNGLLLSKHTKYSCNGNYIKTYSKPVKNLLKTANIKLIGTICSYYVSGNIPKPLYKNEDLPDTPIVDQSASDKTTLTDKITKMLVDSKINKIIETIETFEYLYTLTYPSKSTLDKIKKHIEERYVNKNQYPVSDILRVLKQKHKLEQARLSKEQNRLDKIDTSEITEKIKQQIKVDDVKEQIQKINEYVDAFKITTVKAIENHYFDDDDVLSIDEMNLYMIAKTQNNLKKLAALYLRKFSSGVTKQAYRVYSALTTLDIESIGIATPYPILEYDIVSAYPSFVHSILNIEHDVYSKIMTNAKIKRSEAKRLYMMYLNSTDDKIALKKRVQFFSDTCEYKDDDALLVASIEEYKGDAFKTFSAFEQKAVEAIIPKITTKHPDFVYARRHDSIVLFSNTQFYIDTKGKNIPCDKLHIDIEDTYKGKPLNLAIDFDSKQL